MTSTHEHLDPEDMITAAYWDSTYRERPQRWSGDANRNLVAEVTTLRPGHALDLGCGEGGDAIWLAKQGWSVDAADVSEVALDRAKAAAAEAGVADRITWLQRDLTTWRPERGYELVSAQYFHLPAEVRKATFAAVAKAVRTGGSLLIVGHAQEAMRLHGGHEWPADLYFRPEDITGLLGDPWLWIVETCEVRGEGLATDAVYRARRISA